MIRPILVLTMLSLAGPGLAQGTTGNPPKRIVSVTLTGNQKCPVATGDEVVVCSRIPAGEQYRIPKEVRNEGPVAPQNQAWAAKQRVNDEVGREAAGLPDTCSPVGTGGQTGCNQQFINRAAQDKQQGTSNPPR